MAILYTFIIVWFNDSTQKIEHEHRSFVKALDCRAFGDPDGTTRAGWDQSHIAVMNASIYSDGRLWAVRSLEARQKAYARGRAYIGE